MTDQQSGPAAGAQAFPAKNVQAFDGGDVQAFDAGRVQAFDAGGVQAFDAGGVQAFDGGAVQPFAAGREADVFLLDDGRVLRRYRTGADTAHEAEVMTYAGAHGYPVPAVHSASGTDMVLERLHGPTMAEAALAGDLSMADGAAMMADLLRRLHELPARNGRRSDTIIHLDLHPENIIVTARGPVVIDWRNAGDGPADLDTALSALILAQVAIGSIEHPLGAAVDAMLGHFLELAPGDPLRLLDEAAAYRSRQLTMSPDEVAMIGTAANRVRAAAR